MKKLLLLCIGLVLSAALRANDFYEILGVPHSATEADIKKAYRQKARELHPDKGGSNEAFQELQQAYSTLSNWLKKYDYDKEIKNIHRSSDSSPSSPYESSTTRSSSPSSPSESNTSRSSSPNQQAIQKIRELYNQILKAEGSIQEIHAPIPQIMNLIKSPNLKHLQDDPEIKKIYENIRIITHLLNSIINFHFMPIADKKEIIRNSDLKTFNDKLKNIVAEKISNAISRNPIEKRDTQFI